jgi:hypothetical protein
VKFWIPWGIDAIVAAIFLFFFFWGLVDGTVSARNIVLWLGILTGVGLVVGGSLWLRRAGHRVPAILLTLVLAVPGLLAALFLLMVLILQPRWN